MLRHQYWCLAKLEIAERCMCLPPTAEIVALHSEWLDDSTYTYSFGQITRNFVGDIQKSSGHQVRYVIVLNAYVYPFKCCSFPNGGHRKS